MEDTKTVVEESQTPSHEEKTTFTLEEVEEMKRKMQSDSEKGVQKLLKEKKDIEQFSENLRLATKKVAEDPKYLIDLHDSDPKLAKILLDDYNDGQTIEQYMDSIGYEPDYNDPKVIEKKISQEAEKRVVDKKISEEKAKFIDELKMTDSEKEAFEETFEELKNMKSFNPDNVRKAMEKAYRMSNENDEQISKLKKDEAIAQTLATSD
jgi:hypothetical protein